MAGGLRLDGSLSFPHLTFSLVYFPILYFSLLFWIVFCPTNASISKFSRTKTEQIGKKQENHPCYTPVIFLFPYPSLLPISFAIYPNIDISKFVDIYACKITEHPIRIFYANTRTAIDSSLDETIVTI